MIFKGEKPLSEKKFYFTGNEMVNICPLVMDISNHFTYEFFIRPFSVHGIDLETASGTTGISGKKYAIGPGGTADRNRAGIGISVGTNGISIYEHSAYHLPAVLVHKTDIQKEIHVAVVYRQKTPYLYINGNLIKKGRQSKKRFVHPSILIGGMHPYGYFHGEIRDIRIWNHARTEEQIKNHMNRQLTGKEQGLYFYYRHPQDALSFHSKRFDADISIIIPSYNKYPENTFTLRSLANQTYDLSKVEVIFIDDGSSDETATAFYPMNYPFLMKFIRFNENRGLARSRNFAFRYARGQLIIFIDAETIVGKHFLSEHLNARRDHPDVIVNGVINQKGVFTVYHPTFSQEQKKQFFRVLKQANYPLETIRQIQKANEKTPVITYKDIDNETFKRLAFQKPHEMFYKNQLIKHFGNHFKNFHMPWLTFFTGNVSVPRHLLEKAGLFAENLFSGYGWDDTELGYRLHQIGATFMHHEPLASYHQEHPVNPNNQIQANKNAFIFFNKNQSDISTVSIVLYMTGVVDSFVKLNAFVSEFNRLNAEFPHAFSTFKDGMKKLLLALAHLLAENKPLKNVRAAAKLNRQFQQEMNVLKQKNTYPTLIETCQRLLLF